MSGVAATNRGTRLIAKQADEDARVALVRADHWAHKEERARLLAQIETLQRELTRARRCIYELRRSKDERMAEARAEQARGQAAITILCRIAFPGDAS